MHQIPFYQVDAFASQPFAGNPAAVLIMEDWLTDRDMLAVAEENNIAITAFVRPADAGWELRWFTPTMEADFCGHGTLATAHVLATERGVEGDFVFATQAGALRVSRHTDGYALDLPSLPPELVSEVPPTVMEIIEGPGLAVFRTARHWFVELADERAVRDFMPDLAKIATLHPLSFAVTAQGNAHDFVSRNFAPGAGVPEDSVTGSTHSALVPYWAWKLGKDRLTAFQCSRRGGRLSCELDGDRVRIVGTAVPYLNGTVIF
ncbi:phenazine biosynthesis protein PhzF family [Rhizobium rhizosphaerae]|uniref:Phenazine biosynthesis protein PhzF family n=1 Tax=Xaviernesmea rhizosphaerae TaxID=1672749 RepID=A0A1Q9ALS0_9HYPH|nr:PhzF family phenazine biosynthesis protein [Xaviernesmea rhizosphaerae]OLP56285.1 phenazine biosynthesis protein PhzF family [Xaviernesmea rhizosphaerae]